MSPAPVVNPSAADAYAALEAFQTEEEVLDWPLLNWLDVACEVFVEPVAVLVSERDAYAPWERMLDPDACPVDLLPYLAQYTGATLEAEDDEAAMRAKIKLPENWARCTRPALASALARVLTGADTMYIEERYLGAAYKLRVRTLLSETPDQPKALAIAKYHTPKGTILTFEAITGQSWSDLPPKHVDWTATTAAYATWDQVATTLP